MTFFSFLFPKAKAEKFSDRNYDNAYAFEFKSLYNLDSEKIKLSDFEGKVVMIVNTASQCGFVGQYGELQALYHQFEDKGLVILGVPSNDFGGQEKGSGEEIAKFCGANYGVTFPLTAKTEVTGDAAHPFYVWAREKLGFGTGPKWNFHKYVINRQGELVEYFYTTTPPDAPRVIETIEKLLNEPQAA